MASCCPPCGSDCWQVSGSPSVGASSLAVEIVRLDVAGRVAAAAELREQRHRHQASSPVPTALVHELLRSGWRPGSQNGALPLPDPRGLHQRQKGAGGPRPSSARKTSPNLAPSASGLGPGLGLSAQSRDLFLRYALGGLTEPMDIEEDFSLPDRPSFRNPPHECHGPFASR